MSKNDGGPAFPQPEWSANGDREIPYCGFGLGGISIRDYFAAKAMQALASEYFYLLKDEEWKGKFNKQVEEAVPLCAKLAYFMADEMLQEREK